VAPSEGTSAPGLEAVHLKIVVVEFSPLEVVQFKVMAVSPALPLVPVAPAGEALSENRPAYAGADIEGKNRALY